MTKLNNSNLDKVEELVGIMCETTNDDVYESSLSEALQEMRRSVAKNGHPGGFEDIEKWWNSAFEILLNKMKNIQNPETSGLLFSGKEVNLHENGSRRKQFQRLTLGSKLLGCHLVFGLTICGELDNAAKKSGTDSPSESFYVYLAYSRVAHLYAHDYLAGHSVSSLQMAEIITDMSSKLCESFDKLIEASPKDAGYIPVMKGIQSVASGMGETTANMILSREILNA